MKLLAICIAQRRPGPKPRRHAPKPPVGVFLDPPAQRRPGLNPGDTTRKTLKRHVAIAALNEGRGLNPGDTAKQIEQWEQGLLRSTKAGA